MQRHFFFRHCWPIAVFAAILLGGLAYISGLPDRGALVGVAFAASFSFCYFAHQQTLGEITLLKQLFTEFNGRYDDMNEALAKNGRLTTGEKLTLEQQQTVVDYFNLCAEEYFFRSEGFIPDKVWESWCRGMLDYLDPKKPFRSVWENEVLKNCHYGLTEREIEIGAGKSQT